MGLFEAPQPLPVVDRVSPADAWLYPQGAVDHHCDYSGDAKIQSRLDQQAAWQSGWRPQTPPSPYHPEPPGTPALVYDEPDMSKTTKGKVVYKKVKRPDLDYDPDVTAFDKILVMFSGGKDSIACLLYMIELCVAAGINPSERIECWHHCVDGDPYPLGQDGRVIPKLYIWDWPSTEDYLIQICNHLRIPLLFQWRDGGIMGGVFLRKGDPPMSVGWEEPGDNPLHTTRESAAPPPGYRVVRNTGKNWSRDVPGMRAGRPRKNHRLMWPKVGAITKGRYCSAYVKIEVGGMAHVNSPRLDALRTLIITGERAEESSNRATYKKREFAHGNGAVPSGRGRSKAPRYIEGWKPVLHWCEIEVWGIIARYKITPHPAYTLGWGRLSCLTCIFASKSQFETIRSTSHHGAERFAQFQRAEAALCRIQSEEKRHPARWGKDSFKLALPTIKSTTVPAPSGKGNFQLPLPLGGFTDEVLKEEHRVDPTVLRAELERAGVPPEVVKYHVARAEAGLAVAYIPAITEPELVLAAMSNHLPVEGAPRPGGGVWHWTWSPVEPRWDEPSWLPAGAFGEDAGPT